VNASNECVLDCLFIVKKMGPTRFTQTMTQKSDSAFLGRISPYFLRVCSLFVIWNTWQVEHNISKSCVRQDHDMVFLVAFSVIICPGWSKYPWYQDGTFYHFSQWIGNVDLVLSNKVGLSPFLFILVPWFLLVLWRSRQYTLLIWYYWYCCFWSWEKW
jgi:hypothetical protein